MKPLTLCIVAAFLTLPRPVIAGPSDTDRGILDAVRQRLALADRLTLGSPVHIVVEEQIVYAPPPAKLRRIAEEVARAPEHPDRDRLIAWQRRLRGDGERFRHEIWVGDNETLRLATSFLDQDRYRDHASGAEGVWTLEPARLSVAEKGSLSRTMAGGVVDGIFNHLFYGSARKPAGSDGLQIEVRSRDRGGATVSIGADGIPSILWTLQGDAERGWGLTRAMLGDEARALAGDETTTRIEYAEFREVSGTGLVLPTMVTLFANDGQRSREYRLVSLEASSAAEVADLTRRPSAGRPDPIRGWNDQSIGSMIVAPALPEGEPQLAEVGFPERETGGVGAVVLFVIVGVGTLGIVLLLLLKRRMG